MPAIEPKYRKSTSVIIFIIHTILTAGVEILHKNHFLWQNSNTIVKREGRRSNACADEILSRANRHSEGITERKGADTGSYWEVLQYQRRHVLHVRDQ